MYKTITSEIVGSTAQEGAEYLTAVITELNATIPYLDGESGFNLLMERNRYQTVLAEIEESLQYKDYLRSVEQKAEQFKAMNKFFKTGEKELRNVDKTAGDYKKLSGIKVTWTRTKGIQEALRLPSVVFIQILFGILVASILFTKEKEAGILSLYVSMRNGRTSMFLARLIAVFSAVVICNAVLYISTLLMGCVLYGPPVSGFLSMPLQSLCGFKTSATAITIACFLFCVFFWSCLVSFLFALITATLSLLLPSMMLVYAILFGFIGIEGILYLKIDSGSYLSALKRINIISFADGTSCIGTYRNEFLFQSLPSYRNVALIGLLLIMLITFTILLLCAERGYGYALKAGRVFRKKKQTKENDAYRVSNHGCHTGVFRHELYKFFVAEKMGFVLTLVLLILTMVSKPYTRSYSSMEERFYMMYLVRLSDVEPSEYKVLTERFREELDEELLEYGNDETYYSKSIAYGQISDYVEYLLTKEGTVAVDSKGYELLYKDRKQNVLLGALALFMVILCSLSMYTREYRTGMYNLIRISKKGWNGVNRAKLAILFTTLSAVFLIIYGRYMYLVLSGYGTASIHEQADSIMDWSYVPACISIVGRLILLYWKRFLGILIAAAFTILVVRRVKSYIISAVIGLVIFVVPLLLCLSDASLISFISLNWFFV